MPIQVGLVGCGWFARTAHLPILKKLTDAGVVQVSALCSKSPESIAKASDILGREVRQFLEIDELLADQTIDAVDLVLPTPMMYDAIKKSMAADKHILSEKPCSASVADSLNLLKLYSAQGQSKFWSVLENWRFKPVLSVIDNILLSKRLGELSTLNFEFSSSRPRKESWRSETDFPGGYVLDSGVHFVSLLRRLTGGVDEVLAKAGWRSDKGSAELIESNIRFQNGVSGRFRISFAEPVGAKTKCVLIGRCSAGAFSADFWESVLTIQDGKGVKKFKVAQDDWVFGGLLPMFVDAFKAIANKKPSLSTPSEAMMDVAVIEAMLQSARIERPVSPQTLYPQLNGRPPNLQTYGAIHHFRPTLAAECHSVRDVQISVREAVSKGLKIRAIARGNTWPHYATSKEVSLQVVGLNQIKRLDLNRMTVTVEAGVRLGDLTRHLGGHGLCLPSLPFLADASVGGAISTAMHGTSPRWGTLSDFVVSLKLVTARGELLTLSAPHHEQLLRAARVAIGTLGILVEVELAVIKTPYVRDIEIESSHQVFLKSLPELTTQYEHLWVHWVLGKDRVMVQALESSTSAKHGFVPYVTQDKPNWKTRYSEPTPRLTKDEVMLSMQYGFPTASLGRVMTDLEQSAFAKKHGGREIEIKFLKGSDKTLLGPNSGQDVALINIWWAVNRNDINTALGDFEQAMRRENARPHWGKAHRPPSMDQLIQTFPEWAQFEAIRQDLDPDGTFGVL